MSKSHLFEMSFDQDHNLLKDDMEANGNSVVESVEHLQIQEDIVIDLVALELGHKKFETELNMKRTQIKQLNDQTDAQNIEIQNLKRSLEDSNSKISGLDFELDIAKKACSTLNMQMQNKAFLQNKFQQEKLIAENQSLRELLRKSEMECFELSRKLKYLSAQQEAEASNRKYLLENDAKTRNMIEKYAQSVKNIEQDIIKINYVHEQLPQMKEVNDQINIYKEIVKKERLKREEIEAKYVETKAKLDILEEMLNNYPLPKANHSINNYSEYKEKMAKLEKELEEERELTIQQNNRLADEITSNITLCLQVDNLEEQLRNLIANNSDSFPVQLGENSQD